MAASQVLAVSVTVGLNVAVAAAIEYQVVCASGVVTAVSAVQLPVDGLPKVFPMLSAIPRITRSLALVVVIEGADAGLDVPAWAALLSIVSDTPFHAMRVIHMPPAVAAVIVTGVEEVSVATSTAPYQISMCVFVVDDWALNQLPTPPPLTPDRDPVEVPPTMISTLPAVVVGAVVKGTGSEVAEAELPLFCWTKEMAANAAEGIRPSSAKQRRAANPHRASGRDCQRSMPLVDATSVPDLSPRKAAIRQQLTAEVGGRHRSGRCQAGRRWSQTDRAPERGRGVGRRIMSHARLAERCVRSPVG